MSRQGRVPYRPAWNRGMPAARANGYAAEMADVTRLVPMTPSMPPEQLFPTLTPAQIERVRARGRVRRVAAGEVLAEAGRPVTQFFVVLAGQVDVVRPSYNGELLVVRYEAGQFSGDVNQLSGRPSIVHIRAARRSAGDRARGARTCWPWCRGTPESARCSCALHPPARS